MTQATTRAAAFRCSTESERRDDPMAGTSPPQTRVLLVHQPGAWGPRGLIESRCDPAVAKRIDAAAAKAGMRLQAIRRPGRHEPGVPAGGYDWGIADTRPGHASVTWWRVDDLAELADELEGRTPPRPPVAVDRAPLYLVCAHGRHDPCCALLGRPVAQAIQDARPGRVWETTHLGGDRFAANLLVLPAGDLYGRVPPALAPQIADRADAGEVVPKLMRGRIGLAPVAQAALVHAYAELGVFARDAVRIVANERIDATHARVTVATRDGSYAVAVSTHVSEKAQLTCHGPHDARANEYRATSIERVDA